MSWTRRRADSFGRTWKHSSSRVAAKKTSTHRRRERFPGNPAPSVRPLDLSVSFGAPLQQAASDGSVVSREAIEFGKAIGLLVAIGDRDHRCVRIAGSSILSLLNPHARTRRLVARRALDADHDIAAARKLPTKHRRAISRYFRSLVHPPLQSELTDVGRLHLRPTRVVRIS